MPGLDESALRLAIDAGVRAALAQLAEPENVHLADGTTMEVIPVPEPEPVAPSEPSPLRQAARGQVVAFTSDGEDVIPEPTGMRGDVVPIGSVEPSCVMPAEWFVRQRQRDAALRRVPAWENVVRQA